MNKVWMPIFPVLIPRLNQEDIPTRKIPRFPVYQAY